MFGVRVEILLVVENLVMVIEERDLKERGKVKLIYIIRSWNVGEGRRFEKVNVVGVRDVLGFVGMESKEKRWKGILKWLLESVK